MTENKNRLLKVVYSLLLDVLRSHLDILSRWIYSEIVFKYLRSLMLGLIYSDYISKPLLSLLVLAPVRSGTKGNVPLVRPEND